MKKTESKTQMELRRCFLFTVFCFLSAIVLFGDTWQQTSTSDFNTAGSTAVQTEIINDTVQLAGQSDWWKPAENWPSAMSAWQYRKAITINNAGASALSDYQIKVENPVYNETGLVGSWHFEENTGTTAADMSGNGNNGSLVNNPSWVAGQFGQALNFTGANRVSIPSSSTLTGMTQITMEAWINYVSGDVIYFSKGDGNYLRVENGTLKASLILGGVQKYKGTIAVSAGAWTHTAVTYDGSLMNIYLNGNIVYTETFGTALTTVSGTHYIGCYDGAGSYGFNGQIDEVRLYSRALSPAEIQAHYEAKAKLNYGDIRFTGNSGTEFPYWMEKDGTFWVKVEGADSIPVGLSNIHMYYGNSLATSLSSGTDTFMAFDDFNSYSDGTTIPNWIEVRGDWILGVPSGKTRAVRLDDTGSDAALVPDNFLSISGARVIEAELMYDVNDNDPHPGVVVGYTDTDNWTNFYWRKANQNIARGECSGGSWTVPLPDPYYDSLSSASTGVYYKMQVTVDSTGTIINLKFLNYDGNPGWTVQTAGAGLFSHRGGVSTAWLDNFRVRQYVSSEPSYAIGSEITQTSAWLNRQKITVNAADAVASGYSVKADVDVESLRAAGKVQNDLDDLRVVAYDRTGTASYELDRDIVKGQGLSLNAANSQYISLGTGISTNVNTFTVEAWIKTSADLSTAGMILGDDNGGPDGLYALALTVNEYANFGIRDNQGDTVAVTGNTALNDGLWHHIAGVRTSATTVQLYVDGTLIGTNTNIATETNIDSGAADNIGRQPEGTGLNYFTGIVDEVRFSSSIRYSSAFVPQQTPFIPDSDTVGLWHLDNDAGDSSGQGNNGTLNGSPYYTEGKVVAKSADGTGMGREIASTDSGLVGNWRMNESSWNGTVNEVVDSSGNGKHGTAQNGTTTTSSSKIGSYAGIFNSANSNYITLPDTSISENSSYAISSWIKTNFSGDYNVFFMEGNTSNSSYLRVALSSSGIFKISNRDLSTENDIEANTSVNDNSWHLLTLVKNSSSFYFYVDGVLDGTGTSSLTPTVNMSTIGAFRSGAVSSGTQFFNGQIDEMAIYNRALSASEIREHYNAKNEVWFKTQSAINASPATSENSGSHSYYLYYGNASASNPPENKTNVYQFFDDFEDGIANGWSLNTGSAFAIKTDVKQGVYSYGYGSAGGRMDYPLSLSAPYLMEADVYMTSNIGDSSVWGNEQADTNYIATLDVDTSVYKYYKYSPPSWISTGIAPTLNNWIKSKIVYKSAAQADFYENDKLLASSIAVTGTPAKLMIGAYSAGTRFDNIKVRLYTANEPTLSLGTEDLPYNASGTFTSSVKDTGGNDTRIGLVSWTATGSGALTMEIRADNSDPSGWGDPTPTWEIVTNGDTSVAATGRYLQYRAVFAGNGTSAEPVLTDITVTYTVPIIPPVDSVTCDKLTGSWYSTATFTFTNTTGFGPQINKYYYVWDNNTSYASYTGAEPQWTTGVLPLNAASDGSWYLHYKPYSSTDNAGTVQDLGPFKYDGTVPAATTLSLPLNNASIEESITAFSWDAVTDLSGVSYTLQLDNYTSFSSPVVSKTGLSSTSYTLSGTGAEILIGNSTYYWRVIVTDGASNTSYMSNPSYYKFTTASTIPQMINESTGESYATIQDAINSASTTDGDTISIEDTLAHTESIVLSKDVTLQNGILSPAAGFAVTGQGTAGGEILRNCVITSGGISNLASGENLTIFNSDSSVIVIENSHLVNCLIEFGTTITNSTLDNCDLTATSDYFVSASTGDFRLKSTAVTAIDQGINLGAEFTVDKDGNTKGVDVLDITNFDTGAWDIGAYEFTLGSGYSNPTEYAVVYVYPSGFVFSAQYGTPTAIQTQTMTVSKGTLLDFDWTLQDDEDWLTVSPAAGTAGSAALINVTVDISTLPAGIHEAVITLSSDTAVNVPVEIPVSLVIYENPEEEQGVAVLSTNPVSVSFYVTGESSSGTIKQLTLSNTGTTDLNWTLSEELGWLSTDIAGGSLSEAGTQAVNLMVNTSGFDEGVYTGTIIVTSPEAINSPVQIPVSVYIPGNSGFTQGIIQNLSAPSKPNLLYPAYGQKDIAAPMLEWENMTNATYWIQVGRDMDFTEIFVNKVMDEAQYQTFSVTPGQVYYWRVKAVNSVGMSEWSDTYWFKVKDDASGEESPKSACFIKKIFGR